MYVLQNKSLQILLKNHVLNTTHGNFEQVGISGVGKMHIDVLQYVIGESPRIFM